jgi:PBP1b-binding outer membrane lipoprotein LpoB
MKEAVSQPWLDSYTRAKGRPPVVIIGTIANRTLEHINVQTFVSDLERELTNSQRVTFVASRGEREEVREERGDQAVNALESTRKIPGKEFGADFMLRGTVSAIEDELDGTKAVLYQVDLEMVDLTNNVKAWFGQKKIKKVVDRKRVVF